MIFLNRFVDFKNGLWYWDKWILLNFWVGNIKLVLSCKYFFWCFLFNYILSFLFNMEWDGYFIFVYGIGNNN